MHGIVQTIDKKLLYLCTIYVHAQVSSQIVLTAEVGFSRPVDGRTWRERENPRRRDCEKAMADAL